jgi:hypothetical protein
MFLSEAPSRSRQSRQLRKSEYPPNSLFDLSLPAIGKKDGDGKGVRSTHYLKQLRGNVGVQPLQGQLPVHFFYYALRSPTR